MRGTNPNAIIIWLTDDQRIYWRIVAGLLEKDATTIESNTYVREEASRFIRENMEWTS